KHGRQFGSAVTQADGRFAIAGLPRRNVRIRVENHKLVDLETLDLSAGDKELDLVCEHLATVSGRLTQSGRPVAGARLHLQTSRTLEEYSEPDGSFRIAGVEPGTVVLTADSHDPPGIAPETKLEVGKADITSLQIELGKGASIAGEVVGSDGAPV